MVNNCATTSSAFLGPIFTGAKTGSIYQASLSYSTGKIINEITGMIELEMEHGQRIVKIHIHDEIIALGDIEGKILILDIDGPIKNLRI